MPENTEQNTVRALAPEFEARKWKPGQSGNPGGRPKKRWLTEVFEELLEEKLSDPEFRAQFKESQWAKLMSGRVVGAMTLDKAWERTEGKVVQPIEGNLNLSLGEGMKLAMEKAEERARNRD